MRLGLLLGELGDRMLRMCRGPILCCWIERVCKLLGGRLHIGVKRVSLRQLQRWFVCSRSRRDGLYGMPSGELLRDDGSECSDRGVRGGDVLERRGDRMLAVRRGDDIRVKRGVVLRVHSGDLPAFDWRQRLRKLRSGDAASEHGSDGVHALSGGQLLRDGGPRGGNGNL